ncbi:hypothetical protein IAU60_003388 [Kwoniella sp. DSM 27419]
MQRKALKQLGKVTQWTNEKVFSGEKTQLSSEFQEFEKEIDVKRIGIERLHATSLPFFGQLTKAKTTNDPYPPPGSGKDKISYTEALGLVMIDHGDELGGDYGDGLSKYGRARCKLAAAQEEFGQRLQDNYIAGMEEALLAVNEYKALRKKLDSRRLALDAAISKAQNSKKDSYALEEEVENCKQRFEDIEEETTQRLIGIQDTEERQFSGLNDLLEAELDYHTKCREILDDLRNSWSTGGARTNATRARSNTATSSRSLGRTAVTRSHSTRHGIVAESDEDEGDTNGRVRSHSNASSTGKEKRSFMPSFGSFGKKSLLSAASAPKKKTYGKEKYGDSRTALNSDEEDSDDDRYGASSTYSGGRNRSQSQLSGSNLSTSHSGPPSMRRAYTSPTTPTSRYADSSPRYVKALYDYAGTAADELPLRVGQLIKVETEVSNDWWIGECNGRSGLFPRSYTEEHVPSPSVAVPPPMPARTRNLPPAIGQSRPVPPAPAANPALPPSPVLYPNDSELDSESDIHGFSDADHNFTASLAADARPVAVARERSNTIGRKAAPPPPPSRRSASSNNLLTMGGTTTPGAQPIFARSRASTITQPTAEASPFGHSDDDDESDDHHDYGTSPRNGNGLSHGLGSLHLAQGGESVDAEICGVCGCGDFTQNVFKPQGVCSTCYHQH